VSLKPIQAGLVTHLSKKFPAASSAHGEVYHNRQDWAILPPSRLGIKSPNSLTAKGTKLLMGARGIFGLGLGMGTLGKAGLALQAPFQDNIPSESSRCDFNRFQRRKGKLSHQLGL
jgi:hypothetical protein